MKNQYIVIWSLVYISKEHFRKFTTKTALDRFIQDKSKQYPYSVIVYYVYKNRKPLGRADYRATWNYD